MLQAQPEGSEPFYDLIIKWGSLLVLLCLCEACVISLLNTKGTENTWHGQSCSSGTQLPLVHSFVHR